MGTSLVLATLLSLLMPASAIEKTFNMDQISWCPVNQMYRITVNDLDTIIINARSKIAVLNPPTTCTMLIQSGAASDEKYRLAVTIQSLVIKDCAVRLEIYDAQATEGKYLRQIGCGSKSTDTMYSTDRYVTIKLTRPIVNYNTKNDFTITFTTYRDGDQPPLVIGASKGTAYAITFGIIGVLAIVIVALILCWCYYSGRLVGSKPEQRLRSIQGSKETLGTENPSMSIDCSEKSYKSSRNGIDIGDPVVWSTLTSGQGSAPNTPRVVRSDDRHFQFQSSPYSGRSHTSRSSKYAENGDEKPRQTSQSELSTGQGQYNRYSREPSDDGKSGKSGSLGVSWDDAAIQRGDQRRASTGSNASKGGRRAQRNTYGDDNRHSYVEYDKPLRSSYVESSQDRYANQSQAPPGSKANGGPNRHSQSHEAKSEKRKSKESEQTDPNKDKGRARRDSFTQYDEKQAELTRHPSGLFENPDDEGYMYDYDQVFPEGSKVPTSSPSTAQKMDDAKGVADKQKTSNEPNGGKGNDGKEKAKTQPNATKTGASNQENQTLKAPAGETVQMPPKDESKSETKKKSRSAEKEKACKAEEAKESLPSNTSKRGAKEMPIEAQLPMQDTYYGDPYGSKYLAMDQQSEPGESDTMSNPVHVNAAVRATVKDTQPGNSSPGRKKKKKKATNGTSGSADPNAVYGSEPYGSLPASNIAQPAYYDQYGNPVYDPSNGYPNQGYEQQPDDQPAYPNGPGYGHPGYGGPEANQTSYPAMNPVATGPPVGQGGTYQFQSQPPSHGEPTTQGPTPAYAGKAAWFTESTPTKQGPQQKSAFVMEATTTSSNPVSPEQQAYIPDRGSSNPRGPGYTSTPGGPNAYQPGSMPSKHKSPHRSHGPDASPISKHHPDSHHATRKQNPHDPATESRHPDNDTSVVPHGTIMEDPGPGHKSAVVRSGVDPDTGTQTTQVVWTDTIPDPTDPPGPNPSITRKTVTRVTTKGTYGELPKDPNPILNQLSHRTYSDDVLVEPNQPAFLSPSTSYHAAPHAYGGQPSVPEPVYASEYPDNENVSYYLGRQNQPGSGRPVVHQAQSRSSAIRDTVTLSTDA